METTPKIELFQDNRKGKNYSGMLYIDGNNNFHITKANVLYGNDDYELTEIISCEPSPGGSQNMKVQQIKPITDVHSLYRLRFEPAVELYFDEEHPDTRICKKYKLMICHHKGSIFFDFREITIDACGN